MIKNILAGLQPDQLQAQQAQQMQMPQMPMQQQPVMMDPYGQQNTGIRAALMGRFMNAR